MSKRVVLVKLGGSCITNKAQFETLNEEGLVAVCRQLVLCMKEGPPTHYVLVHGAGSFGHFQAKQYGTALGHGGCEGAAVTHSSVAKLNARVVEALIAEGRRLGHPIHALGVSALACGWATTNGGSAFAGPLVEDTVVRRIAAMLQAGFTPVLHGDVAQDDTQTWAILSGDVLMERLSLSLDAAAAIFLSDVDGVFSSPPAKEIRQHSTATSQSEGTVANPIPKIYFDADGVFCVDACTTTSGLDHDVTGGMAGKLKRAIQICVQSKGTVRVFVARGGSPDAAKLLVLEVCEGGRYTEIVYRES